MSKSTFRDLDIFQHMYFNLILECFIHSHITLTMLLPFTAPFTGLYRIFTTLIVFLPLLRLNPLLKLPGTNVLTRPSIINTVILPIPYTLSPRKNQSWMRK